MAATRKTKRYTEKTRAGIVLTAVILIAMSALFFAARPASAATGGGVVLASDHAAPTHGEAHEAAPVGEEHGEAAGEHAAEGAESHEAATAGHGEAGAHGKAAGGHGKPGGKHEGSLHLPNFLVTGAKVIFGPNSHQFHLAEKIQDMFFSYFVITFLCVLVVVSSLKYKKFPKGMQGLLELYVKSFDNFAKSILGDKYGPGFTAYLGTMFIYILCLNFMGLIPLMKSSIAFNFNMPFSLALCTIGLVQYHGIKQNGIVNYFKHFVGEPWWLFWLNIPLHMLGEYIIKPASLTLRLTMNITAEDAIMGGIIIILAGALPIFLPIPAHAILFPLALLFSTIQAFVFTILSAIYISQMSPHEHEHEEHDDAHGHGHEAAAAAHH